ncbi:MAG: SBBP repeat-containing protein [Bacteroidia bacterium]|nr:SBBP repeat-containing protein [Bacteroidia bacterium]
MQLQQRSMKNLNLLTTVVFLSATTLLGQNKDAQKVLGSIDNLFFIENKGQWDNDVLYLCRMNGLDVWITKYGTNYTFYKIENEKGSEPIPSSSTRKNKLFSRNPKTEVLIGHRVIVELQNHNSNPLREGKKQMQGYFNYFIGRDQTKHATYVGLYKEVLVKEVYKGIDIRYYFDNNKLRYDFLVHPYADASQIKFKLNGQHKTYLKDENKLYFTTLFGEVGLVDLHTYQENQTIPSKFVKNGENWQISVENYDKSKMLIIDPLVYSTYVGGSGQDWARGITVDNTGHAYITGWTASTNYDITPGTFQTAYGGGGYDAFVTKININGTGLVFSTYIGGSGFDEANAITIDNLNEVYVTGYTTSTDYDVTWGAYQTGYINAWEVFVTKLNSTGTGLIYSTYIGGFNDEGAYGIAVDANYDAYVVGFTRSTDYKIVPGSYKTTHSGAEDVFVTKINSTGNSLIYSTYLGGSGEDFGNGITINSSGEAFVTGWTASTNYDITPGAFQTANGGGRDCFVTKLNAAGTALIYSTYIGGSSEDLSRSIVIDGFEQAYITGGTQSTNYDVIAGGFQTTNGGGEDVFVTKLNASGNGLIYSTYIGGSNNDSGFSIYLDQNGVAYITGQTQSTNYDVTTGCYQNSNGGGIDVFLTKLNAMGSALLYSTYVGGSSDDQGRGVFADDLGYAYITGWTNSTNYDITTGAFQTTNGGSRDAFVTKICTDILNSCAPPLLNYPIELTAYLSLNALKVNLDWKHTATEKPIQQFIVERKSQKENTWRIIAKLSPDITTYQDNQDIYYGLELMYCVKAVDKDGQIYRSNVVSVIPLEKGQTFSLYPNPTLHHFVIENYTDTNQEYELTDASGKVLRTYTLPRGSNTIQIDLPKSIYFIREKSRGITQKLVIE